MSIEKLESIYQQFQGNTAEEWKQKIIQELKGESFEQLTWHSSEGIDVLPFYTKEDNLNYQLSIPKRNSNSWQIVERIIVDDIKDANKQALEALQYGATSIVFNLQHQVINKENIQALLQDILLDVAPVRFENYKEENRNVLEKIKKNSCTNYIKIPEQSTISDELAVALLEGIKNKSTHFHFYIKQNYFFEIAKLRAFRWLWKQAAEIYNLPNQVNILCETSTKNFDAENEYSNILRNTTAAMSAIIGGCDELIINTHECNKSSTNFGRRIARNIQHILQQESYFNELDDAGKGSYYIEYLTYQLSKNSWEKFQQKINS